MSCHLCPLTERSPSLEGPEVDQMWPQDVCGPPHLSPCLCSRSPTSMKHKCRWPLSCLQGSKRWLWEKDLLPESQPAQAAQKAFPASLPSPAQARSLSRSPTPDRLEPGDDPTACSAGPVPFAPLKHIFSPLWGDLSMELLSLLGQALSCLKIMGEGERQRDTD